MIKIWVLFFFFSRTEPVYQVDNIYDESSCLNLLVELKSEFNDLSGKCISVNKRI